MQSRILFFAGAAIAWLGCSSDATTASTTGDASTGDSGTAHDGSSSDGTTGSDTGNGDGSSSNDSSSDGTTSSDAGLTCGNTTCNGADVCCATIADGGMAATLMCMPSCPDGGVTIACDSPAQCTGAKPICCADLVVGAGNPPACPFQSASAACATTCPTQIPASCPGMGQVVLCRAKSDCTDAQNANCCTFMQGGQSATFCANNLVAGFASSCAP